MGVDVIYNRQNTSSPNSFNSIALPAGLAGLPATSVPAACNGGVGISAPVPCYHASDQDAVTTTLRIQRDFLP